MSSIQNTHSTSTTPTNSFSGTHEPTTPPRTTGGRIDLNGIFSPNVLPGLTSSQLAAGITSKSLDERQASILSAPHPATKKGQHTTAAAPKDQYGGVDDVDDIATSSYAPTEAWLSKCGKKLPGMENGLTLSRDHLPLHPPLDTPNSQRGETEGGDVGSDKGADKAVTSEDNNNGSQVGAVFTADDGDSSESSPLPSPVAGQADSVLSPNGQDPSITSPEVPTATDADDAQPSPTSSSTPLASPKTSAPSDSIEKAETNSTAAVPPAGASSAEEAPEAAASTLPNLPSTNVQSPTKQAEDQELDAAATSLEETVHVYVGAQPPSAPPSPTSSSTPPASPKTPAPSDATEKAEASSTAAVPPAKAESVIAAKAYLSRKEAGGWFAKWSLNWLIGSAKASEAGKTFSARVQNWVARVFDTFSWGLTTKRAADILNVDATDVVRLLNRRAVK